MGRPAATPVERLVDEFGQGRSPSPSAQRTIAQRNAAPVTATTSGGYASPGGRPSRSAMAAAVSRSAAAPLATRAASSPGLASITRSRSSHCSRSASIWAMAKSSASRMRAEHRQVGQQRRQDRAYLGVVGQVGVGDRLVLAGEVVEEGARGDVGRLADLLDRDLVEATLVDQAQRGIGQRGAGLLLLPVTPTDEFHAENSRRILRGLKSFIE